MNRPFGRTRADGDARTTRQATSVVLAAAIALLALGLFAVALPRLGAPPAQAIPLPGPIDIGFAQSMSLHHQQAIGMAQLMLDGRPTPLTPLARSIVAEQLLELGEMRGWLRLWDAPLIAARQGMDWMRLADRPLAPEELDYLLDCQRSPTGMSGLATDQEVDRLRQPLAGTAGLPGWGLGRGHRREHALEQVDLLGLLQHHARSQFAHDLDARLFGGEARHRQAALVVGEHQLQEVRIAFAAFELAQAIDLLVGGEAGHAGRRAAATPRLRCGNQGMAGRTDILTA